MHNQGIDVNKKINITVATDIHGQGGVATVLSVYKECGFFENNRVKLITSHSSNNKWGHLGAAQLFVMCIFKLAYYILFHDVGLVHIHMSSRGSYKRKSLLVRMVKALNTKVILHLHGAEFREFYANECDEKKKTHIRKTFEMSDKVIVLSSHWLDWAYQTLNKSDHVNVIYNAVPTLSIKRSEVQPGTIAFLGRIGPRKGALDLIHAFKQIKHALPHATLMMAGDGNICEYKEEAKKLGIDDSVHFLGWVSGLEKLDILKKADVYCLPSYNEGFPMGVLEAMSAGIAVVSSYAGGIPDAISDGVDGLLVDAGDIKNLEQALITMISDRDANREFVNAAKTKFDDNFSLDAIIPQMQKVYDDTLGSENE